MMIRWIRSLFAWRLVRDNGVWTYWENEVTGQRAARKGRSGYQPLDMLWILEGQDMPLIEGMPAWRSRYRDLLPDGWQWS